MRELFERIFYSLAIQLLFHHLKRNLHLLSAWGLFALAVSGGIGKVYGIHYLFLDPEYLDRVDFWSFFIVGLAFANFTMAFLITSYILDGHKFSFVGLLERPFLKFSLNNAIIPLLVLAFYLWRIIDFQLNTEVHTLAEIGVFLLGFMAGTLSFLATTFVYFRFTNKDIFKYLAGSVDKRLRKSGLSRERIMDRWKESRKKRGVRSYLDLQLRSHDCTHLHNFYDRDAILKVFDQNHFNSVIFDLGIIVLVLLLGVFMDTPFVQIPAAASTLLMFSIFIMMVGAITYWFKGWGITFVVILFVLANFFVAGGIIKKIQHAPGMDYASTIPYDLQSLQESNDSTTYRRDREQMLEVLHNWKGKQDSDRPPLIIICASGGGQRAALWTFLGMQQADEMLNGQLMRNTFMISGASGGMVGAAYYRELYRKNQLEGPLGPIYHRGLENLGKDNLNPIIFSLVVNDTFLKLSSFVHEGHSYKKDRGYMFERSLNSNLNHIFTDNISGYYQEETNADIPWMLLSPTIANDGRKLYISNPPVSFMSVDPVEGQPSKIRGVDFRRYFEEHGAANLPFLTALRMSASFPYITPTVSLPSRPRMEVMDAGVSDNFGISVAVRFIQVFRTWIEDNTGGVILLTIRDSKRIKQPEARPQASIVDKFSQPISDVYNNLANIQDIKNDQQLNLMREWLECPLEVIEVAYDNISQRQDRASLSWHLTTREKETIVNAMDLPANQAALQRLGQLMVDNPKDLTAVTY